MVLTLLVISCQVPSMLSTLAVTPKLPFVPTSCATRVTSLANVASYTRRKVSGKVHPPRERGK